MLLIVPTSCHISPLPVTLADGLTSVPVPRLLFSSAAGSTLLGTGSEEGNYEEPSLIILTWTSTIRWTINEQKTVSTEVGSLGSCVHTLAEDHESTLR